MKASQVAILSLCLVSISATASASCMRIVPVHIKHRPDPDGAGAFSPLQDTLTLDCLVFTGVVTKGKENTALLLDEKGMTYKATLGSYVGENTGRVIEITAKRITIRQMVRDAEGGWIEVLRYKFLGRDDRI